LAEQYAKRQAELDAMRLAAAGVEKELSQLQTEAAGSTATSQALQAATQALASIDDPSAAAAKALIGQREQEARDAAVKAAAAMENPRMRSEALGLAIAKLEPQLQEAAKKLASVNDEHQKLAAKLEDARAKLATARAPVGEAVAALEEEWSRRFAMTGLRSLTPEQLCWSILEATGQIELQRAAAAAELTKKQPLSPEDQKDAAKVAAREVEIQAQAHEKLKGNVATFVNLFAAAGGQPQGEFFATADQALFFRNGSQIKGWIGSGGDSLYQQLRTLESSEEVAETLYLNVLSRRPDDVETKAVTEYLNVDPKQRDAAVEEIIWALLTSIEFRFRH
jgi:hypothetical protein